MKGDGTDLCCIIHPIRRHKKCDLSFCEQHWWDDARARLDLPVLPDIHNGVACSRCGTPLDHSRIGDEDMWVDL